MTASAIHTPGRRRVDRPPVRRSAPPRSRCWPGPLARYTDECQRTREVIASRGPNGSVLVLDRDPLLQGGALLVAHLGADEPVGNAALVCERYLGDARRGRCRPVTPEDFARAPYPPVEDCPSFFGEELHRRELVDRRGEYLHRLELVDAGGLRQLRWRRHSRGKRQQVARSVSLREVAGALESYELPRALTRAALARYRDDRGVVLGLLREELTRLNESPIVLNRKLREAVLGTIDSGELSMGEIALRCGRAKRCRNGKLNGETSWLARRLGLLPESGAERPTPWIHSDVLALIARSGIGISPGEVELS
jgi:hypothetical protein